MFISFMLTSYNIWDTLSSMKPNRIIKRTNPFSGQSEMLTHDEAMLHDQVKQAEAMGESNKMQKALTKFSKLNPKAYMTLLD